MMKKAIIYSITAIVVITFTACNGSSSNKVVTADTTAIKPAVDTTKSIASTVKYTCKMHPEIILDKPGKCPKCGMELVPIETGAMKDSMPAKQDSTMKMN